MTQNVIWRRWFLNKEWFILRKTLNPFNGFLNVPNLISINHEGVFIANFLSNQLTTINVTRYISSDFNFECSKAQFEVLLTQFADSIIGISHPTHLSGIGGISGFKKFLNSFIFSFLDLFKHFNGFCWCDDIRYIAEINRRYQKLGFHGA
uniref:Uncharacterized protein n=1 Tax=Lutzomyia longipalpis TaxID=7200 RepID=A0A7G3B5Y9_LUTLO